VRRSPTRTDLSMISSDIERYLETGDHDELFGSWPGNNMLERAQAGSALLRGFVTNSDRR
jgi:hypothetical protein